MKRKTVIKRSRIWMTRAALALVASHLSLVTSMAQSFVQVGSGLTDILDTYLSQEKFKGEGMTFLTMNEHRGIRTVEKQDGAPTPQSFGQLPSGRGAKPVMVPCLWSTIIQNQVSLSLCEDRDGNQSMMEGTYNLYAGRYRTLVGAPSEKFHVQAGGLVNATLGFLYNTRNGNNPAQARIGLQVMPSAVGTWRFRLFKTKYTTSDMGKASLRYEADLPLAGLAFSPNYGQSYYEIFAKDNYDHNIVPTTFVSAPSFRQQLTLSCHATHRLTLQVGYLGDWQQLHVNNLKQHVYAHHLMIGVAKGF